MTRHRFSFTFEGPIATAGEISHDLGVDRPMARDAFGRLVLPATLIKGAIREALDQVASLALPGNAPPPGLGDLLFGNARRPGALVWSDAVRVDPAAPTAVPASAALAGLTILQPDDLKIVPAPAGTAVDLSVQSQVAIDRRFGRARDEALAFREGPGYGEETTWSGTVDIPRGAVLGLSESDVETLLLLALHWLDALGTDSGVGWGWIDWPKTCLWDGKRPPSPPADAADVVKRALDEVAKPQKQGLAAAAGEKSEPAVAAPPASAPPAPVQWLDLAVVLHGPLLVGDLPRADNLREATPYIPGAAIKRAIADVLLASAGAPRNGWVFPDLAVEDKDLGPLVAVFDNLQVRHALPVPLAALREFAAGGAATLSRPVAVPLTALRPKNGKATCGDAFVEDLCGRDPAAGGAQSRAMLAIEWLDGPAWACDTDVAEPRRIARTRTAINRTTRRADDQNLFTYLALAPVLGPLVEPEAPEKGPRAGEPAEAAATAQPAAATTHLRQTFVTRIGIPATAQPKTGAALVKALGQVRFLGKSTTSGFGAVRLHTLAGEAAAADPAATLDGRVNAWKQAVGATAAAGRFPVVLNTDALLLPPFDPALQQGADLQNLYEAAWKELVTEAGGPAVSLHPDFGVVATHVLRGAVGGDPEHGEPLRVPPVVLTRAGSAFLLTCDAGDEQKLRQALVTLSHTGLERRDLVQAVAKRWDRPCPYRATNGYGEIVVCYPIRSGKCEA